MSGPIIRKYGFPNFDQIFGKKDLQHGVDEGETPAEPEKATETPAQGGPAPAPKPVDPKSS